MPKELVELTLAVRQDSDITTVTDIAEMQDQFAKLGIDMGNCEIIVGAAAYAPAGAGQCHTGAGDRCLRRHVV